ncbi:putative quinol monooxygenase [uncultured Albimonas sp.]|uniref:putative quinol monooxygenase n=1 Tax=uncultured Albimonas sp. TaxID=1331701 RepID=UPI0030ECF2D5|tara:strand:- start:6732 stop:7040 length:309 start_codon:yes stop_codon:yes gene_type:complete
MTPDRTEEVRLLARLTARPGREQALRDAIADLVPRVLVEDGCIAYHAHVSDAAPATVVMYEAWRDQAALDVHAAGPALAELAARFDDLLAEPMALEPLRRFA